MSIPKRHASPEAIHYGRRTFFVTASAYGHQRRLQADAAAELLIDTLFKYRDAHRYELHEFVVMPDHVHLLLTAGAEMTIERAVQFIKGGYSYRAARELGIRGEVWQRGFSESRILTADEYRARVTYIWENPVRAGLASTAEEYRFSSASKRRGLDPPPWPAAKAAGVGGELCGTTKVVP